MLECINSSFQIGNQKINLSAVRYKTLIYWEIKLETHDISFRALQRAPSLPLNLMHFLSSSQPPLSKKLQDNCGPWVNLRAE